MSRTAADLLDEARQLPLPQQRWLGRELLDEEETESPAEIAAGWDKEIQRRLNEIDSSAVQMAPLEDVLA
jgi:hypothetical protein